MNLSLLATLNNLLEPSPPVQFLCAVQTTTPPVQPSAVPECLPPERTPLCSPQRRSQRQHSTLILYREHLACYTLLYSVKQGANKLPKQCNGSLN